MKTKIELIIIYNTFKVIFIDFFAKKQKSRNSIFREANLILSKLINIRSPSDESTLVLR